MTCSAHIRPSSYHFSSYHHFCHHNQLKNLLSFDVIRFIIVFDVIVKFVIVITINATFSAWYPCCSFVDIVFWLP